MRIIRLKKSIEIDDREYTPEETNTLRQWGGGKGKGKHLISIRKIIILWRWRRVETTSRVNERERGFVSELSFLLLRNYCILAEPVEPGREKREVKSDRRERAFMYRKIIKYDEWRKTNRFGGTKMVFV